MVKGILEWLPNSEKRHHLHGTTKVAIDITNHIDITDMTKRDKLWKFLTLLCTSELGPFYIGRIANVETIRFDKSHNVFFQCLRYCDAANNVERSYTYNTNIILVMSNRKCTVMYVILFLLNRNSIFPRSTITRI